MTKEEVKMMTELIESKEKNTETKENLSFSKIILVMSNSVTFLLVAFYCYMTLIVFNLTGNCDFGSLTAIILAFLGEITVSNGFYYWKAKREFEIRNEKTTVGIKTLSMPNIIEEEKFR